MRREIRLYISRDDSRHTNASQLYRSYVARLVSREEAGRFCSILPTKNPAQVATGRGL